MLERNSIKIVSGHPKKRFQRKKILSLVFFAVSLSLSIYQIVTLFSSPLGDGRIVHYLILLPSLFLTIFLGFGLLRYLVNFTRKNWIFTIFQLFIASILPLLFMTMIENRIQENISVVIQKSISSIIIYIDEFKEQNGAIPDSIEKALTNSSALNNITYYSSPPDIFMIETSVPSIDIDGVKIFYDSRDRRWYQFHNDEYQYYQDKNNKPKSITQYMFLEKQMKKVDFYTIKTNGQWIKSKQKFIGDSDKHLNLKREK